MSTKRLGRTREGVLTVCQAKPENVGKGKCSHHTHFEIPVEKVQKTLLRDEEQRLERKHQKQIKKILKTEKRKEPEQNPQDIKEQFYTKERYAEIESLKSEYSKENMSFVNHFAEKFDELLIVASRRRGIPPEPIIERFLQSKDPLAVKVRNNFDKDVSEYEIAKLLCNPPRSIKRRVEFKDKNVSTARLLLSRIDSNMDRINYVKTVVYFGGRCCYCRKYLENKNDNKRQATGEHLTPLSPSKNEKNALFGSNRFGNVVICCSDCNQKKDNSSLEQWIAVSSIEEDTKNSVIARIEMFREFAEYRDFNKEFTNKISAVIDKIIHCDWDRINKEGKDYRYGSDRKMFLNNLIHSELEILNNDLNKY